MKDEPKRFTASNHNGPNYKFSGWLLCEHTTDPHKKRDRWQETKLYETVGGAYVAVLTQRTLVEGEHDKSKSTVIEPWMTSLIPSDGDEFKRRLAVMDALDWTPCARAMVRKIGWRSWSIEID